MTDTESASLLFEDAMLFTYSAALRAVARGGVVRGFVAESWAELKKVEWPTQSQLIQGVVVVLIACLVVGVFLYTCDLVWKRLVQDVLL